jgi:hypothetical protein
MFFLAGGLLGAGAWTGGGTLGVVGGTHPTAVVEATRAVVEDLGLEASSISSVVDHYEWQRRSGMTAVA